MRPEHFAPTVDDLDTEIAQEKNRLDDAKALLRETDNLAREVGRKQLTAQRLVKGSENALQRLTAARDALAVVARYNGRDLTPPVTMPVEAPAQADYLVLRRVLVPSSNQTTSYDIEVRLYGQPRAPQRRVVLTCSCARFRFTRGEYAHGTKQDCKHIKSYRALNSNWLAEAANRARARGIQGILTFRDGRYERENSELHTNTWDCRIAVS